MIRMTAFATLAISFAATAVSVQAPRRMQMPEQPKVSPPPLRLPSFGKALTECNALRGYKGFRIGTTGGGAFTVVVHKGNSKLFAAPGKAGNTGVVVPLDAIVRTAKGPVMVGVFTASKPGKNVRAWAWTPSNVLPQCDPQDGCTPPPCPEPPGVRGAK